MFLAINLLYLVYIGLLRVESGTIDRDIMDMSLLNKRGYVIKHNDLGKSDKGLKNKLLNTIKNNLEDITDEDNSGMEEMEKGFKSSLIIIKIGSGYIGDKDDNDNDNEDESGSGEDENNDVPKTTTNKPFKGTVQKTAGTWTLSCPSPCSQACAPACTPQCCLDNFAMAPPVPENMNDMYLCPSFCTDQSCSSSCPSYCCALPMIEAGNFGSNTQSTTCSSYCSNFSPVTCPTTTCNPSCCNGQSAVPDQPISVTLQYGYPSDLAKVMQQSDADVCASYCSTPQLCQTNMFCPQNCCQF
ncbi:hypothetical protein HZS_2433 [Henneguya salminicola]|nr:hypothetical protein HZS_2433 [Henneguya salminicola]